MAYTLLDIVQTVLSSVEGDEVNSITETTEAVQVALIVKRSFYNIATRADLPEHSGLFNLTASDASTPVVMYKPDTVSSINWLKYDKQTLENPELNLTELTPLSLTSFLDLMYKQDPSADDIDTFTLTVNGSDSFDVLYKTTTGPTYYTTIDDSTILFDAIDTEVDTYLRSSKTLAYGELEQTFLLSDDFIPNLDENQFNLLINESIALAAVELKQQVNPKVEAALRRDWIALSRKKNNIPLVTDLQRLPDYGRKLNA